VESTLPGNMEKREVGNFEEGLNAQLFEPYWAVWSGKKTGKEKMRVKANLVEGD